MVLTAQTLANASADIEFVDAVVTQMGTATNRLGATRKTLLQVLSEQQVQEENATASAATAVEAATSAQEDRDGAELARAQAESVVQYILSTVNMYANTAAGLAATSNGAFFSVPGTGDDFIILYKNNSGTAQEINRYPSKATLTGMARKTSLPWLSVKDYGAAGNNTADDTAAITAAIASNAPLVFAPGIYKVSADLTFPKRVQFASGAKINRTAGKLVFNGGIDAPVEQVFINTYKNAAHDNIFIDPNLTPYGWCDWFGYDVDAAETVHNLFFVNLFGPRDYLFTRTAIFDQGYRNIRGAFGSAEGPGGTRFILTGDAAKNQAVVQIGNLEDTNPALCARKLEVYGINTVRDGIVDPAASEKREDAAPGWLVSGWYEGTIQRCFDNGSPIGFRVLNTVGCKIIDSKTVRPIAGSSNGHPDFYTAFCVGAGETAFGFIGANGSIEILGCECAGAVGEARIGIFLFGLIGDTWIRDFKMSQMEHGVYADGGGFPGSSNTDAHQDVFIDHVIADACTASCVTIKRMNAGGTLELSGLYGALDGNGAAVLIQDCNGAVTVRGGQILGKPSADAQGIKIMDSHGVSVKGTIVKNAKVGVWVLNSDAFNIEATLMRTAPGGTKAVFMQNASRGYANCIVKGNPNSWEEGYNIDSASGFVEVNVSAISYGSFTVVDASKKITYNGSPVTTTAFGNNMLRTGVTG